MLQLLPYFVVHTIILDKSHGGIINGSVSLRGVCGFFSSCACVRGFTSDTGDQQKDLSLWRCCCCGLLGAIFPSLLWSRIAPVSGMVALCPCDNALVIRTHYSNGCWYKDLLTLGVGGWGGGVLVVAALGLCILRPLYSDCLPLQQPAPPLATPLSNSAPLEMVGRISSNVRVCVCTFYGLMLA